MGHTTRQPRRLNRSQIQEILERNMQLYRNEEHAATYLVELALYLLEYEYDWADSPERAPASVKEQMAASGAIVEVPVAAKSVAVSTGTTGSTPAPAPASKPNVTERKPTAEPAPAPKPNLTERKPAAEPAPAPKPNVTERKPAAAPVEPVRAPVSFEDAWAEVTGGLPALQPTRRTAAGIGSGNSPVKQQGIGARQSATMTAPEPKAAADSRFISPDLRKMTEKYGTMTNRCPHCGTAIDRETLCPSCKNLVR